MHSGHISPSCNQTFFTETLLAYYFLNDPSFSDFNLFSSWDPSKFKWPVSAYCANQTFTIMVWNMPNILKTIILTCSLRYVCTSNGSFLGLAHKKWWLWGTEVLSGFRKGLDILASLIQGWVVFCLPRRVVHLCAAWNPCVSSIVTWHRRVIDWENQKSAKELANLETNQTK